MKPTIQLFLFTWLQLAVTILGFQKSLHSTSSTTVDLQSIYDNVFQWAKDQNQREVTTATSTSKIPILSDKIKPTVRDAADGGAGLFAIHPIDKGEVVIHLPTFDAAVILDHLPDGSAKTTIERLYQSESTRMAAFVGGLTQMQLLRNSDATATTSAAMNIETNFGPFLDILSATDLETHMLFWSSQEIADLLDGSVAQSQANAMRHVAGKILNYLRPYFAGEFKLESDQEIDTLFRKSFACTTSRAFIDTGYYKMLPVIDLINHKPESNVYVSFTKDDTAILRASKDIAEGEELYLNYGARSSWEFGVEYGFCPDELDGDSVAIPILSTTTSTTPDESINDMVQMITAAVSHTALSEKLDIQVFPTPIHEEQAFYHHYAMVQSNSKVEDLLSLFSAASTVENAIREKKMVLLEEVKQAASIANSKQCASLASMDSIRKNISLRQTSLMEASSCSATEAGGHEGRLNTAMHLKSAEYDSLDEILERLDEYEESF